MEPTTLSMSAGAATGHGRAAFSPVVCARRRFSIGDQQAAMAVRACRDRATVDESSTVSRRQLACLHCGAAMRLVDDRRIDTSLHLLAECPRCGCLRATSIELGPGVQPFLRHPAGGFLRLGGARLPSGRCLSSWPAPLPSGQARLSGLNASVTSP